MMTQAAGVISFAPVDIAHETLVLSWLGKSHVNEWFHGEGLKNTIEGLRQFVRQENQGSDLWLAFANGDPFAFIMTSVIEEEQAEDPSFYHSFC